MNMAEGKTKQKVRTGVVVSAKMNKTIVVSVEQLTKHPIFGKYIRKRVKLYAHDEDNQCQEGDKVEVVETRPLSKLKRWRVSRVIEKAVKA
jgi:small subunit ribosomal protein S17